MPDGEWTPDLEELLNRLRTDAQFRAAFTANRRSAVSGYDLTGHERRAVIEGRGEELVALGIVDSVAELPPPLGSGGGGTGTGLRLPRAVIDRLRAAIERLVLRRPPRPGPGSGPGPPPGR